MSYDPVKKEWTLVLSEYHRNNLMWLINACGYPWNQETSGVEPFTFANTGDWLGELAIMLDDGSGNLTFDRGRSNRTLDELRDSVEFWKKQG